VSRLFYPEKLPELSTLLNTSTLQFGLLAVLMAAVISTQAAPTVTTTEALTAPPTSTTQNTGVQNNAGPLATANRPTAAIAKTNSNTLAAQRQPSDKALSAANQELLSRNAQLQRQVNDLQTQVNVLVYESKGQLFLYGAFTVLISLLVGIFISWLVFVRRERW
jgi:membrane-bound lytic murein transglycosylase